MKRIPPKFKDTIEPIQHAAKSCGIDAFDTIPGIATGNLHAYEHGGIMHVIHASKESGEMEKIVESSSPKRIIETMDLMAKGCQMGMVMKKADGITEKLCAKARGTMNDEGCNLPDYRLHSVARVDLIFPDTVFLEKKLAGQFLVQANAIVPLDYGGIRDVSRSIPIDEDSVRRWLEIADEETIVSIKKASVATIRGMTRSVEMKTIVGNPVNDDKNLVVSIYRKGSPFSNKASIIDAESGETFLDSLREWYLPAGERKIKEEKLMIKKGSEFLDSIKDKETREIVAENYGISKNKIDDTIDRVKQRVEDAKDYLLKEGIITT